MNNHDEENQLNIPRLQFKPCSPLTSIASELGSLDPGSPSEPALEGCPICLEEKQDFHFIICGHKVCTECNRLLREHGCFNKCPICRCPLSWVGYVEFNGENFVLREDTPRSVVRSIISISQQHDVIREIILDSGIEIEPGGIIVARPRVDPQQRIVRHTPQGGVPDSCECFGNMLCAVFVMIFVIFFGLVVLS